MQESNNTVGLIMWVFIISVGIAFYISYRQKVKRLKEEYEVALSGHDKRKALIAGRAYYSALRRKNRLTIYDEQAITNDLSAMDATKKS